MLKKISKLATAASEARRFAFASRSEHKIGAAVLTLDGKIYGGCNIESNISGLGICAERNAINHAIINGKYRFKALLTFDRKQIVPCGACLQYLLEFYPLATKGITIITMDIKGNYIEYPILELIPKGYFSPNILTKIGNYE